MYVNLIDKDKNSYKNSTFSNKKSESSSISNFMIQKDKKIKIFTIFTTIFLGVSILLSVIFSFILDDKRILTFQYGTLRKNKIPDAFHTNIYFIYLFLISIIFTNFYIVYVLFKESDRKYSLIIFSDLKWYFVLFQFLIGLTFFVGIGFEKGSISIIISFSLNLFCVISLLFYYKNLKSKQNLDFSTLVCSNIYNSTAFSFLTFISFYNFSELMINSFQITNESQFNLQNFSILSYSLYCFIGIVLLTYYQDVIYMIVMIYFLLGIFLNKNFNFHSKENIAIVVIIAFSSIAFLITLIRYGKSSFGYQNEEDLNEVLIAREKHKKSSWFYAGQN